MSYANLSARSIIGHVVVWQVIGFVLVTFHVLLSGESMIFFPLIVVTVVWLHLRAPLAAVSIYFQVLLYQNLILSVFSQTVEEPAFTAIQGTSFTVLAAMAAISFYRLESPLWQRNTHVRKVFRVTLFALVFAIAYGGLGIITVGMKPTMIYFREITSILLALLVGLDVGRIWGYKTVATCFLLSVAVSVLLTFLEIGLPVEYYHAIHAVDFMNTKFGRTPTAMFPNGFLLYSPQDLIDYNTQPLFNITGFQGDLKSFRFDGSMMNIIAYGYVLSITALVAVSLRKSAWLVIILPLLVYIGVKGALLLFTCTILMWFIWLLSKNARLLLISGIILGSVYVGFGIYSGLQREDFHVIGFLGGVKGFMSNPLGRGLGVGGNLSTAVMTGGVQWTGDHGLQKIGADFAVESAIGVMIYQMGVAAAVVLAVFVVLLQVSPFAFGGKIERQHLLFIATAVVAVNGVFQEEAFSPNAAGMLMMFCGILVSNGQRIVSPAIKFAAAHAAVPVALLLAVIVPGNAAVPEDRLAILASGVNLTTVFADDYRPLQPATDLRNDIHAIHAHHFAHIRIMVNTLWVNRWDNAFLQRLDAAVKTALDEQLGVILCLNAPNAGQLVASEDDAVVPQWFAAWQRLAGRYAPLSIDHVFFELANEPQVRLHWPALQERIRVVVRQIAREHTLILTGSPNSTPQALVSLPINSDENVVYAFHLYQPMIFTHQAAEWAKPRYGMVKALPYPPTSAIEVRSDDLLLMQELANYKLWGGTVVRSEVDLVAAWARKNHVNLIATEYGVFRRTASAASRAAWLSEVYRATHDEGIGSTVWEYRGGFGIQPDLDEGCTNPIAQGLTVCP